MSTDQHLASLQALRSHDDWLLDNDLHFIATEQQLTLSRGIAEPLERRLMCDAAETIQAPDMHEPAAADESSKHRAAGAPSRARPSSAEAPELRPEPARARILVVDDDHIAAEAMARLLRARGFSTSTASDGVDALAEARRDPPEIVITDLRMPNMDGVDLCRSLRELDPDLPVIVVTSDADTPSAIASLRAGADDYLSKPIDIDALMHRIERALERKSSRVERARLERQRDEYIALIAHDLRGPLHTIVMSASLLKQLVEEKVSVDAAPVIERLARNAQRMNAMIEELLESATLESGGVKLVKEPCALGEMVSGIIRDLDDVSSRRIVLEAGDPQTRVLAEPAKIERAIANLITNALKYSPEDSIVRVLLTRTSESVVIEVVDHGVGIAAAHLRRLFERHYRAPTGGRFSGLGLGLYITGLIVEAHGGRVEVESDVGKGSTFSLRLPLHVAQV